MAVPATDQSTVDELMNEVWRPVVGFEGFYEVSSFGRVRSVDRRVPCAGGKTRQLKGKLLASKLNAKGYPRVPLCKNNKSGSVLVHRLVAMAFVDNHLSLPCINHKNGDKTDNRPDNLEWCTHRQNSQHALASGLYKVGEKHHGSKHTRDQALMVLGALRCGVRHPVIIGQFGVTQHFVTSIAQGTSQFLS